MFDWNDIDTVMLDMDGTLLDLHFDNYFWVHHLPLRYAQAHNCSEKEAGDILAKLVKQYEGTLQWYCLDHWSELVNLDIPALKMEIIDKIQIRPYAELFLEKLRKLDKKLMLITNAHPKGLRLKLGVTKIDRLLDIVISSHELNTPKEEQGFWHALSRKETYDPTRTLFIDDTPRVLNSAREYGIRHLVCINQPDSQKPPQMSGKYIDIRHFDEIMPNV